MEKLENYDLDVMNVLKDFPKNNEDSFLFIRGEIDPKNDKYCRTFIHTRGTNKTLTAAFYSIVKNKEIMKEAAYNAVLNCLLEGTKEEREYFISILKEK